MDWFLYDNGLRHERVKVKKLKVTKNQEFTNSQQIHLKKTMGGVKLSPQPFQDYEYFHEPVTNFYARLANCIYLQSVKPVTFIYINIVQGKNFPKQYHALNTVFRLFHSYAEISNIS